MGRKSRRGGEGGERRKRGGRWGRTKGRGDRGEGEREKEEWKEESGNHNIYLSEVVFYSQSFLVFRLVAILVFRLNLSRE